MSPFLNREAAQAVFDAAVALGLNVALYRDRLGAGRTHEPDPEREGASKFTTRFVDAWRVVVQSSGEQVLDARTFQKLSDEVENIGLGVLTAESPGVVIR